MHLKFKVTYTLTLLNPIAKQVRSKIMSENQYDLVILGGGTAGYVAAIRASQLGNNSDSTLSYSTEMVPL